MQHAACKRTSSLGLASLEGYKAFDRHAVACKASHIFAQRAADVLVLGNSSAAGEAISFMCLVLLTLLLLSHAHMLFA